MKMPLQLIAVVITHGQTVVISCNVVASDRLLHLLSSLTALRLGQKAEVITVRNVWFTILIS